MDLQKTAYLALFLQPAAKNKNKTAYVSYLFDLAICCLVHSA